MLEPPAGGGEERHTRGQKALPLQVFSIQKPEKEKKGVGGGGGGGRNERSWPINDSIKWMEQKDREINGGHRKRRVSNRRKARGEEQWACEFSQGAKILQPAKISQPGKFPGKKLLQAHYDTCKTED